jgi:hypothetical protein
MVGTGFGDGGGMVFQGCQRFRRKRVVHGPNGDQRRPHTNGRYIDVQRTISCQVPDRSFTPLKVEPSLQVNFHPLYGTGE